MRQAEPAGRFQVARVILILVILGLSANHRLSHRETFYNPTQDSALLTYWAQAVADAGIAGIPEIVKNPHRLVYYPENIFHRWLAVIYTDSARILDTSGLVLSVLWMKIFGSSLLQSHVLACLLAAGAALAASRFAHAAAGESNPDNGFMVPVILSLVLFNPYYLCFSGHLTWHGFAVALIFCAYFYAGAEWRVAQWPARKRLIMGLFFTAILYSVILIPVLFTAAWALADLAACLQARRDWRRSLIFWCVIALAYLPGVLISLLGRQEIAYWIGYYSDASRWTQIPSQLSYACIATGFILPLAAFVKPEIFLRFAPVSLFSFFVLILGTLGMNSSYESRIFIYLLPLAVLTAGALWCRNWGRAALVLLAGFWLVLHAARPAEAFRYFSPPLIADKAVQSSGYLDAARYLNEHAPDNSKKILIFENWYEAIQILSRAGKQPRFIGNFEKWITALETGDAEGYLRRQYPYAEQAGEFLLVTRRLTENTKRRMENRLELDGLGGLAYYNRLSGAVENWSFIELRRKS